MITIEFYILKLIFELFNIKIKIKGLDTIFI